MRAALRRLGRLAVAALLTGVVLSGASACMRADARFSAHVDCSRSSDGDGSAAAPWNRLTHVFEHGAFHAGDRILIRRGTVCRGSLVLRGSGTRSEPILVTGYGAGPKPLIMGGGTADGTGAVWLENGSHWIIAGLAVTNRDPDGPDDTDRSGILISADSATTPVRDITVAGNVVSDVTSDPASYTAGGIVFLGSAGSVPSREIRIERNRITDVGRTGLLVWNDAYPAASTRDVAVLGNTVSRAQGDSILLYGVNGGAIDRNVSRDGGSLPACPRCTTPPRTQVAGIWPTRSQHISMRWNEVSGENASGGDGEGLDVDILTSDVVVEGNFSHDNGGGGVLLCGTRRTEVISNVFARNDGAAITFSCPQTPSRIRIVGNDLLTPVGASVVRTQQGTSTDPIQVHDNFIAAPSGGYGWPGPIDAGRNAYAGAPDPADTAPLVGAPELDDGDVTDGIDGPLALRPSVGSSLRRGPGTPANPARLDYFGALSGSTIGAIAGAVRTTPSTALSPELQESPSGYILRWTVSPKSACQVRSVGPLPMPGVGVARLVIGDRIAFQKDVKPLAFQVRCSARSGWTPWETTGRVLAHG